ncbi:MAG: MmcB family DNA repair protein [Rhizobiales bacterium]|nr:MmcB family DNA repair protein [Hyphomicrobiales bacterium]
MSDDPAINRAATPANEAGAGLPVVPVDGRQSPRALEIARGTVRLLRQRGYEAVAELVLADGRRADLVALSQRGEIWIIEIKSSLADYQADGKWPDYLEHCDQFAFAVGPDFPLAVLPDGVGLIVADRYGAEELRPAPAEPISPARRKAVLIRFARAAAARLSGLADPLAACEQGNTW